MQIMLNVNESARSAEVDADMPLLWVLRETLGPVGTEFGCGMAACGACTLHIDGAAARSCSVPAASVQSRSITTLEGIVAGTQARRVQQARSSRASARSSQRSPRAR